MKNFPASIVESASTSVANSAAGAAVVETGFTAPLTAIPGANAPALLPKRFAVPTAAEQVRRLAQVSEPDAQMLRQFKPGNAISFQLFDGRVVHGRVNLSIEEANDRVLVGGELIDADSGSFSLAHGPAGFAGMVVPTAGDSAYVFEKGREGDLFLVEKARDHVVCTELPAVTTAAAESPGAGSGGAMAAAEVILSSRPTATAVAYLDFDGETVTDPSWNGGNAIAATASGLSDASITEVWRRVAEDYRAFNIDVTTDRSRYDSAPAGSRMRCVITQFNGWYGSSGGVAYIGSWGSAGQGAYSSTVPCWVFSNLLGLSARYVAEAASHEIGHTLGLSHDGLTNGGGYYSGHGTGATSWAPIMGSGYYNNLVQWSKGEYVSNGKTANNTEDDLAIISDPANHAGYGADDASGTRVEASALRMNGATSVRTIGAVERTGDSDTYIFKTGGGAVSFTLVPEVASAEGTGLANLDAKATLTDGSGAVVAEVDVAGSVFPSLSATVASGTYYLTITGMGEGAVNGTGYSNYGSLGRYEITGSVPAAAPSAPTIAGLSSASVALGAYFTYQIEAVGGPTGYNATGLPAGLSINTANGYISGTPTAPGSFSVTLSATNAWGTATKVIVIDVSSTLGLAVEAGSVVWTSGGGASWGVDSTTAHVGSSSARSGAISHNGETWLEATLSGPGTLSFWWRVSSQANADYLRVRIDGVEQASISGSTSWAQRTLAIGAGTHVVRWSYTKNGSSSSGSDAGWIDGVSFAATPTISSATTARAIIGLNFTYQINATNNPTSFNATGLPAGLSINTTTGVVSGTPAASVALVVTPVTISATNAAGTGSQTLQLDVKSGFGAWVQDHALGVSAAAPNSDPDGDGSANLVEYSLGLNPMVADSVAGPTIATINDNGVRRLEITFICPPARPDVAYTVEVSSDMKTWTPGHAYGAGIVNGGGLPTQQIERVSLGAAGERIRVRDIAGTGAGMRFIHLKVSAP